MLSRHARSFIASFFGLALIVAAVGAAIAQQTTTAAPKQARTAATTGALADRLQGHADADERQVARPRRRSAAAGRGQAGPVRRSAGAR